MKRVWKFSEFHKCLFSLYTHDRISKPSGPIRFICQDATQTPHTDGNQATITHLKSLFTEKWGCNCAETIARQDFNDKVSKLKKELLGLNNEDVEKIDKVLEENGVALFKRYSDGSAIVELLKQLKPFPYLAMEVFWWRRKQLDYGAPMTVEEYAMGVTIAGRLNDVDLAVELFKEASNKKLKGTSLFNALMTAYSYNGFPMKCQTLFRDLKTDPECTPSIVTYNILISSFGRMMLADHMEAALGEIKDLNLAPNVNTYKALISGYITAWMWEKMEKTYQVMKASPVRPNLDIHLLMLRGYAIAGKMEKMEDIYEMVRDHVDHKEIHLIRVMIRAYCKSSDASKVQKVEQLLKKIPENDYRPWLNVILICLYANENLLEQMENAINEAFMRKTYVTTVGVMNAIISSYFRHDAVDKLHEFVQHAELAGWKSCRSLYHCKMVMYASQMRLSEMERVLHEMSRINMHLSKKTYWILYKAYLRWGERHKLEQVIGMLWKHGYKGDFKAYYSSEYSHQ